MNFNVANMFKPAQTAPQQPPQQPPAIVPGTGMPNQPANPNADPDTVTGDTKLGTANTGEPSNPLDAFTDLFKLTDDDRKKAAPNPFAEPLLKFDGKKFAEAASKMNFASAVDKETIAKALGGDVDAFSSALNRVTQASFVSAAQVFSGILEQAVAKNNGRFDSVLSDKFKSFQLNYQRPENPALQHPAAAPMLEALKATISTKDPTLRPDDVTKRAEEFLNLFAESIVNKGKKSSASSDSGTGEIDWSKYLETEIAPR